MIALISIVGGLIWAGLIYLIIKFFNITNR